MRKVRVPFYVVHLLGLFAVVGGITVFAAVGSYGRMLWKAAGYNELRRDQERLQREFQNLQARVKDSDQKISSLQSLATRSDGWTPPIVKTVASQGIGVQELMGAISDYDSYLRKENLALHKSVENWQERLIEMLRDALLEKARAQMQDGTIARYAVEIAEHKRDPYTLVEEIAANLEKS